VNEQRGFAPLPSGPGAGRGAGSKPLGVTAATAAVHMDRGTLFDPDAVDACLSLLREKRFRLAP